MALILVSAIAGPADATAILSTDATESPGQLNLADYDLIEYRPITYTATLYLSERLLGNSANLDGVYITSMPEPAPIVTLGLGCMVLVGQQPKQKKHGKSVGENANKIIDGLCPSAGRHAKTQDPRHKTQAQ